MIERPKPESAPAEGSGRPEVNREIELQIREACDETWRAIREADALKNDLTRFSVSLQELTAKGAVSKEGEKAIREAFEPLAEQFKAVHRQACAAYQAAEHAGSSIGTYMKDPYSRGPVRPEDFAQRDRSEYDASRYP